MKIAVTFEDGKVFQHFGHTEYFRIYEVNDKQIVNAQTVATNGSGHGALAAFLVERGVEALICGGIGGGALNALADSGIKVFAGVSGDADARVRELLDGTLVFAAEANCSHHHEHGEGHTCGEHGCGHESCGK